MTLQVPAPAVEDVTFNLLFLVCALLIGFLALCMHLVCASYLCVCMTLRAAPLRYVDYDAFTVFNCTRACELAEDELCEGDDGWGL